MTVTIHHDRDTDIQEPVRRRRGVLGLMLAVVVLVLPARDSWSDKVAGLVAGADDYRAKPFQTAELIARLRALCAGVVSELAGTIERVVFPLPSGLRGGHPAKPPETGSAR